MRAVEPAADLDQHLVAGGVAEGVVDVLKSSRSRKRTASVARSRGAPARWRGGRARRTARGWQARDGVVERLMGELRLERLALADVARVEDDAADVLVVDQVREEDLEVPDGAVVMAQRGLLVQRWRLRARAHGAGRSRPASGFQSGAQADERQDAVGSGEVRRPRDPGQSGRHHSVSHSFASRGRLGS